MGRMLSETGTQLASWREPSENLRQALAKDELTLFCQPIASLAGGTGFPMAEVLVRLRQEEKALMPPGEFLPVFEQYGLMPGKPTADAKAGTPGERARAPGAMGVETLDMDSAPVAPAAALDRARGVEDMVKQQADERAARMEKATR